MKLKAYFMIMSNIKNAGRKPTYIIGTELIKIQKLIPIETKEIINNFILETTEKWKNKNLNK